MLSCAKQVRGTERPEGRQPPSMHAALQCGLPYCPPRASTSGAGRALRGGAAGAFDGRTGPLTPRESRGADRDAPRP